MSITDLFSIGNNFWIGLANHLWQSTLFAIGAWLIILFLKKNRARIRYWVWFSVSIKFLIPFSLFISFGSLIAPEWVKTEVEISTQLNIINTINQPFNLSEMKESYSSEEIADASTPAINLPVVILAIWGAGAIVLIINWHKRVIKVSNIARKAEPLNDKYWTDFLNRIKQKNRISATVQLASARDMMEPGVFGILKPVLFLPEEISRHINDAELEAILIHEFEHIRCKDNLIALIHMLVQAMFWFHPVVWWAGSRLVFERELACDEAVLEAAKNPRVYAEGIIKVCETYFNSPMVCVSGVIGSNLKKRMEGIMKNQIGYKLGILKKLFLSAAGLSILGVPLLTGILNTFPGPAYSSGIEPDMIYVGEQRYEKNDITGESERINSWSETINVHYNKNISGNNESFSMSENGQKYNQKEDTGFETNKKPGNFKGSAGEAKTPLPESFKIARNNNIVVAQNVSPEKSSAGSAEYISQGFSSLKQGKVEDAITQFNRAIDLDPEKAVAYAARGSAYFRLEKLDNAISDYNKAIAINPELEVAYQGRGSVYFLQGQLDNAISDYTRVIKLNPGLVNAYIDRGNIFQEQGKFDEAISDYSKVLEIHPKDALIYYLRGNAYFQKKQYDDAISDYSKAVELDTRFAVAYQNRGTAYQFKGEYQKALSDCDKAIELMPDNSLSYASRGNAYFMLNRLDNASSDYNRAVELDPEMGNLQDAKKIECRRIAFLGSKFKERICLTKSQWEVNKKFSMPNNKFITQEELLNNYETGVSFGQY
jgi:tetratricopeptide (TPR) repeat protein/beta-lactamase regulating signal transducer with metallopeptidase domain